MTMNLDFDAPTHADLGVVVPCSCERDRFGMIDPCARCEGELAEAEALAQDEPMDLYAGDWHDQEYGDGW
jgi:hypothetical protein